MYRFLGSYNNKKDTTYIRKKTHTHKESSSSADYSETLALF